MSTYGLQIFDGSGTLIFDSTTAAGGVVVDLKKFVASDSGTFTYPLFAGRAASLVGAPSDGSITMDTALGYPRVIVTTSAFPSRVLQLWCA